MEKMIQLDIRSRTKNPTPPKNLRLRNPDFNPQCFASNFWQSQRNFRIAGEELRVCSSVCRHNQGIIV